MDIFGQHGDAGGPLGFADHAVLVLSMALGFGFGTGREARERGERERGGRERRERKEVTIPWPSTPLHTVGYVGVCGQVAFHRGSSGPGVGSARRMPAAHSASLIMPFLS